MDDDARNHPDQHHRKPDQPHREVGWDGPWQRYAGVVHIQAVEEDVAVAFRRQREEYVEPEEELHQQRNVAEELNVSQRELGDDPVPRQPRDADDDAERSSQYNADDGNDDRVRRGYAQCVEE